VPFIDRVDFLAIVLDAAKKKVRTTVLDTPVEGVGANRNTQILAFAIDEAQLTAPLQAGWPLLLPRR
jgi:hypothetical protein